MSDEDHDEAPADLWSQDPEDSASAASPAPGPGDPASGAFGQEPEDATDDPWTPDRLDSSLWSERPRQLDPSAWSAEGGSTESRPALITSTPSAPTKLELNAPRRRPVRSWLFNALELVVIVAVAVVVAIEVQAHIVKPYRIPSGSMIPTLSIGQRILVNRLDTHPKVGDVVVFHPPVGAENESEQDCGDPNAGVGHQKPCDRPLPVESTETFVKRVVGLPGDHLRIENGIVYRNGKREKLAYTAQAAGTASGYISCASGGPMCSFPVSITVPAGEYYMMGDNRGDSLDSRYWGPVPQKWIIGVAFFTYWPIDRVGTL